MINSVPEILSPEDLDPFIKTIFGTQSMVKSLQVVNRKNDYLVVLVDLISPPKKVVIKMAGPNAAISYDFERSAVFYNLVTNNTDIPMPEVYALDVTYQQMPWRYVIKTYLPGEELAEIRPRLNVDELAYVFRQIGNALAQLHAINFPFFGEVNPEGAESGVNSLITALHTRAQTFIRDEILRNFFIEYLSLRKDKFEDIQIAELTHEDLHQHNLLFRMVNGEYKLATILDFDKAWAGHGESDLARLDLWRGMQHDAFWQAYRQVRQVSPGYSSRRPIYQLFWCLEFGDPGEQHYNDTMQVCRKLGISLPHWFED